MRLRRLFPLFAVALAFASCGQRSPDRGTIPPIPDDLEFPALTTTTLDPIPSDGLCYLVESGGARVTATEDGYDVARHINGGDVITGIDDAPVTSSVALINALSSYRPGDVVRISFLREGAQLEADVQLGSPLENPAAPRLGVIVEPAIVPIMPADLGSDDTPATSRHIAIANDEIYLLDPLAGDWRATGGTIAQGGLISVLDRLYMFQPEGEPVLTPIAANAPTLAVPTGGLPFFTALTTLKDQLVVALGALDREATVADLEITVHGANLDTGELVWTWRPEDSTGLRGVPFLGYSSPTGDQAVIIVDVAGVRLHTLLGTDGNVIAGFGSDQPFLPVEATFAGWYTERSPAYLVTTETEIVVATVDVAASTAFQLATFAPASDVRQIWTVGDGKHLLVMSVGQTELYEVATGSRGRPLSRACNTVIRSGPLA